jgi:hypothetical protein
MLLTSLLPMAMLTTVMTVQQRRRNQNTSRTGRVHGLNGRCPKLT